MVPLGAVTTVVHSSNPVQEVKCVKFTTSGVGGASDVLPARPAAWLHGIERGCLVYICALPTYIPWWWSKSAWPSIIFQGREYYHHTLRHGKHIKKTSAS